MQTLEVTDEQYAYIQHLREQISEQVVGKYGTVRERDAVQFLIDNLDDELDVDEEFDPEHPSDARAMSYQEDDDDGPGEPTDTDEEADDRSADDEGADSVEDADDEDDDTGAGDAEEDTEDAETDSADEEATSDGENSGGEASDDDMLDRMMNLLDTHDDKWEESPAADYRYRVDLPEGGTEDVQTKDDVRALLFKHY